MPTVPQRFAGYAAFLAFPGCLEDQQLVATILDLSHVGGSYHAVNVSRDATVQDLLESVAPDLDCDLDAIQVWVGRASQPRDRLACLGAVHGDVIIALRVPNRPPEPVSIESLFWPGEPWDLLRHMPLPTHRPANAVWFRDELQLLDLVLCPGRTVTDVLAARYRVPADALEVIETAGLPDLCVKGVPCHTLAVVFETASPAPPSEPSEPRRPRQRIICDLRYIGLAPVIVECPAGSLSDPDLLRCIQPAIADGLGHRCYAVAHGPASANEALPVILVKASVLEPPHEDRPVRDLDAGSDPLLLDGAAVSRAEAISRCGCRRPASAWLKQASTCD